MVEVPVSFQIRNTSAAPPPGCLGDGVLYTVSGHLVATRNALRRSGPKSVSVLIGGFDSNSEWLWRGFDDLQGYDTALELARLGDHITLSLDMLGHGRSGRPRPGHNVCFATQADVLHQIVQQLRGGQYSACGRDAIAFSRVLLVGHDIGPAMANMEAHLYGDVDGLVGVLWANQGFTPWILQLAAQRAAQCAAGGDGQGAELADGYVLFGPPEEEFRAELFHSMDDDVADAVIAHRERNPCGYIFPLTPNRQDDPARFAEIDVPVLLLFPEEDPVIDRAGQEAQAGHFSNSPSVSTVFLRETGHFPMFERTGPCFRELLSEWLSDPFAFELARGAVSSACALPAE